MKKKPRRENRTKKETQIFHPLRDFFVKCYSFAAILFLLAGIESGISFDENHSNEVALFVSF
jgi:hypothetical protein